MRIDTNHHRHPIVLPDRRSRRPRWALLIPEDRALAPLSSHTAVRSGGQAASFVSQTRTRDGRQFESQPTETRDATSRRSTPTPDIPQAFLKEWGRVKVLVLVVVLMCLGVRARLIVDAPRFVWLVVVFRTRVRRSDEAGSAAGHSFADRAAAWCVPATIRRAQAVRRPRRVVRGSCLMRARVWSCPSLLTRRLLLGNECDRRVGRSRRA